MIFCSQILIVVEKTGKELREILEHFVTRTLIWKPVSMMPWIIVRSWRETCSACWMRMRICTYKTIFWVIVWINRAGLVTMTKVLLTSSYFISKALTFVASNFLSLRSKDCKSVQFEGLIFDCSPEFQPVDFGWSMHFSHFLILRNASPFTNTFTTAIWKLFDSFA